jgi:ADP-ribose pyrophosphatase YjhB (NUDIX family)
LKNLLGCEVLQSTNFAAVLAGKTIDPQGRCPTGEKHALVIGIVPAEKLWCVPIIARRDADAGPIILALPSGIPNSQEEAADPTALQARRIFKEETGLFLDNRVQLGTVREGTERSPQIPVFAGIARANAREFSRSDKTNFRRLVFFPLGEWVKLVTRPGIIPAGFAVESLTLSATLLAAPRINAEEGVISG